MSKTSVATTTTITTIVEPLVEATNLFLEDVYVSANAGLVRVVVDLPDGPGAIDSDTLNDLTREISRALDDADPIEDAYTLEVSTPGAERQLTQPRHYRRCQGHLIEVKTNAGDKLRGRVVEASDDAVLLQLDDGSQTSVDLDTITKARSRVELTKSGE